MDRQYLPLRGATSITLSREPINMVYRCSLRHEVSLQDDGTPKTRDMIRHVWWLHTRDMPRTGMPIWIFHKSRLYTVRHESGLFCMYSSNTDMTTSYMKIFRGLLTPHHLFYMLDTGCGMNQAVKEIGMTERSISEWTKPRSYKG